MKPLLLSLALFLATSAGLPAAVDATPPPESPPFAEVLALLEQQGVFSLKDPGAERRLVDALLAAVGCGARLVPKDAPLASTPPLPGAPVLLAERYAYLYLATLDGEQTAAAVAAALAEPAVNGAAGLILDLRYSAGGQSATVQRLATDLGKLEKPLVLLTGTHTAGGAELLSLLARARCGAVTVGQPTRGCCVSLEPVPLAGGARILLPKPLPPLDGIDAGHGPLAPDVTVEDPLPEAQVTGLTPERFAAFPERDPVLRHAVDLLTTVSRFGRKRF